MDLLALSHLERCDLLDGETARVTAWLRSLDPGALDGPAIGDWTIRQVVAHLVGVAEFYAGNVERGAAGDIEPPKGRPPAGSMRGASAAAGVAAGAAALAEATAADPIGAFERSAAALAERLRSLGPDQLDLPGYHPGGLLPLNRFLLLRAKELCVHDWDLRAPTDPSARISDLGVAAVLLIIDERIASGSLRWAYQPDAAVDEPVRIHVRLDGGAWDRVVTVDHDTVEIEPETSGGAAPSGRVSGEGEAFVRLVYGRAGTSGTLAGLEVEPASLAPRLTRWFGGI